MVNKVSRGERKSAREMQGFGRHVPWAPDDLPSGFRDYWPRKDGWPTKADVDHFIGSTSGKPDARLAVLSGLRRWSEPASSQMLATFGSVIISIVAIAIAASTFNQIVYFGVLGAGAVYILLALTGVGLALRMDERRRMAFVWLRAIEDGISETPRPRASWPIWRK